MDAYEKRSFKVTNSRQFQVLVTLMSENLQLAKSIPIIGNGNVRFSLEEAWDDVARQINVYGPPERSGFEWRKIWADLKWRTKKKVFENSKIIQSGEGAGRILYLSELEQTVDKILEFSASITPQVIEESPKDSILEEDLSELLEPCIIKTEQVEFTAEPTEISKSPVCAAKKSKPASLRFLGKRKYEKSEKQLKLLQLQIRNQEKLLAAIQKQSKATEALAEAANRQAESMAIIAESTQSIALAFRDAIKYFKKDESS